MYIYMYTTFLDSFFYPPSVYLLFTVFPGVEDATFYHKSRQKKITCILGAEGLIDYPSLGLPIDLGNLISAKDCIL